MRSTSSALAHTKQGACPATFKLAWAGHWAALDALLEGTPLRSLAGAPGLAPLLAAGGRLAALVRLLERGADVPPADTRALLRLLLAGSCADSRGAHEVLSLAAVVDEHVEGCIYTCGKVGLLKARQHEGHALELRQRCVQ